MNPSRTGAVATTTTTPGTLTVAGDALSVEALRWLAIAGILLAAAGTVFLVALINVRRPNGEAARIRTQYGHLIVPIKAAGDELWTPFEVTSIEDLVRLAERSERLILHHHDEIADTYFVNDEGAVYRYKAKACAVSWEEWRTLPDAPDRPGPSQRDPDDPDPEPTAHTNASSAPAPT